MTSTRRRVSGEAGMGLAELLVAMAVSSVLLLALGTTFAGSLRSSTSATTRVSNTAELRLAMDTVARRLRVAVRKPGQLYSFEVATPTSMRFYASLLKPADTAAQPPTLVEYALAGECLQESRTVPTGSALAGWSYTDPAAMRTTTCLARGALNADGAALFTYYSSGALDATPFDPAAGAATPAEQAMIRSVQVTAALQSSATSSTPPTRLTTRVTLVNVLPTG